VELCKQELKKNPNSFVLLGDIGVGGFLDSNNKLHERVLNMGIAEQAMIGFASGLSSLGSNVIVHTISAFLVERALEQIKLCCGYNENKLILVSANGPYDYEKLGPTHHCPADVNLLSTIPNLCIRVPATIDDLSEAFYEATKSTYSYYIRLTSRSATLQINPVSQDGWKKIYLAENQISEKTTKKISEALVCIGESLSYAIESVNKNITTAIFWTLDPFAVLPDELSDFENITVLEPYLFSCMSDNKKIKN
jgi:deoxyxylulose-5-phosphate synthase